MKKNAFQIFSGKGDFLVECRLMPNDVIVFSGDPKVIDNLKHEVINGPDGQALSVKDGSLYFEYLPSHLTNCQMIVRPAV